MDATGGGRQTVRVTIFNQSYSIVTADDPAETQALAQEVDEVMTSIARQAGNLDGTRTAVLTCLHLADQLRTARAELAELRQSVGERARSLNHLLDQIEGAGQTRKPGLEAPPE